MDAFAYLSVLLSIILGLGLTQLLTATGRLIRHRERVRFDWLAPLGALVLLVSYVQVWWAMFGLRGVREWTFIGFLVVLAQTMSLYLMAAVVLPELVDDNGVDLRAHYERQHRWFYGFFIATLVISVLKDVVIGGKPPAGTNLAFHVGLGAIALSAMVIRARRYQELVGIACGGAMVVYIALLFTHLH